MNTPSPTPSIDARELFRLASLIGCEPEDEARHRADLKAFVDQYVSEHIQAYVEPHIKYCEEANGLSFCKNCQLTRPAGTEELQDK